MNAEGVTTIVHRLKPHIQDYFDELIDDGFWMTKQCHRSYEYPAEVTYQRCWPNFGIFYDYLIRREIYVRLGTEAVDNRAEMFQNALYEYDEEFNCGNRMEDLYLEDGRCISANYRNIDKLRTFLDSYENFKDIDIRTTDILEDVFNTSMLHMMSYNRRTVPFCPEFINWYNIKDVLKYARTWDLRRIEINPNVSGRFFFGDADLIFDNSIMDMKVSRYDPDDNRSTFKKGIYQMLFYALGHFYETGKKLRKFKVYNPLLGVVHILDLPYLDFNELRRMVDNEPCWEYY